MNKRGVEPLSIGLGIVSLLALGLSILGISENNITNYNNSYYFNTTINLTVNQTIYINQSISFINESMINLSDNNINDATALRHGFLPKLNNYYSFYFSGIGSWINLTDFVANATASTIYLPTSITCNIGTITAGNVSSLWELKDNNQINITEASGTPGFNCTIHFTNISTFNRFLMNEYYQGSPTHNVNIYLNCNLLETYDTINGQTNYTFNPYPVPDPQNHICDGNVSIVISHVTSGNPTHKFFLEYLVLEKGFTATSVDLNNYYTKEVSDARFMSKNPPMSLIHSAPNEFNHTLTVQQTNNMSNTVALNVVSLNRNMSAIWVTGYEQDAASLKISHVKPTGVNDSEAAAMSLFLYDAPGENTKAKGLFINAGNSTGSRIVVKDKANINTLEFTNDSQLFITSNASDAFLVQRASDLADVFRVQGLARTVWTATLLSMTNNGFSLGDSTHYYRDSHLNGTLFYQDAKLNVKNLNVSNSTTFAKNFTMQNQTGISYCCKITGATFGCSTGSC